MSQEIEDLIQQVSANVKEKVESKTVTFQQILASSSQTKKVADWTAKDFFHYYTDLYEKATKNKYLVTYSTDLHHLKSLRAIFVKHTMSTSRDDFKQFLDWCYDNRVYILKDSGNFLLVTLRKYINRYVADSQDHATITPKEENFLEKLREKAKKTSRFSDMLKIYGIPIMVTYMVTVGNKEEKFVLEGLENILRSQYERKAFSDLKRIAKQSIALSPYPKFFNGTNWRQDLIDIWEELGIMDEDWWRPTDYTGQPAEHYQELKGV